MLQGRNSPRARAVSPSVEASRAGVLRRPSGQNRPITPPPRAVADVPLAQQPERPKTAPLLPHRRVARPLDVPPVGEGGEGAAPAIAVPRAYAASVGGFSADAPAPHPAIGPSGMGPGSGAGVGADVEPQRGAHAPHAVTHRPPPPAPTGGEQRAESPSQRVHQRAPPPQPVDQLDTAFVTPRAGGVPSSRVALRPARLSSGGGGGAQPMGASHAAATAAAAAAAAANAEERLAHALGAIARLEAELAESRGERAAIHEQARADAKAMAHAARSLEGNQGALGDAVRTLEAQLEQARREHEALWAQARADKRVFERVSKELERQARELERTRDAAIAAARDTASQLRETQHHVGALQAELREARSERERQARVDSSAAARELRAIKEWVRHARDRDAVERGIYCDELGAGERRAAAAEQTVARADAAGAGARGEVAVAVALDAGAREQRALGVGAERSAAESRAVEALAAQLAAMREAVDAARAREAESARTAESLRSNARAALADADSARAELAAVRAELASLRARVGDGVAMAGAAGGSAGAAALIDRLQRALEERAAVEGRLVRAEASARELGARAERVEAEGARERALLAKANRALEADKEELRARVCVEAARAASAHAQLAQFSGDKEFCLEAIRQLRHKATAVAAERDALLAQLAARAGAHPQARSGGRATGEWTNDGASGPDHAPHDAGRDEREPPAPAPAHALGRDGHERERRDVELRDLEVSELRAQIAALRAELHALRSRKQDAARLLRDLNEKLEADGGVDAHGEQDGEMRGADRRRASPPGGGGYFHDAAARMGR